MDTDIEFASVFKRGLWVLPSVSFLMAMAHGAGMMLIPALTPLQMCSPHGHAMTLSNSLWIASLAVAVHSFGMLLVTGVTATSG
jgi:hypothetical protein